MIAGEIIFIIITSIVGVIYVVAIIEGSIQTVA